MSAKFKAERQRLIAQIEEWNANRLDLFNISQPNEHLEFFGVMRFFYQDDGEKVFTKCIRVSSTATTRDVMATLIEKFRPDMRMLSRASYALYETHVNGEERQLNEDERPLVIQLNWGIDDREGRFLLKKEVDKTLVPQSSDSALNLSDDAASRASQAGSFRRKLSKREKKELKKKEKEQKMSFGKENNEGVAHKLYTELPESSFTRSISNPELVMRKRRQLKLEKKLQDIRNADGGPDSGGTLKIYGHSINPDVPYKTLLLSISDTVRHVIQETLDKYGMSKDDPNDFCLVQVMLPPDGPDFGKDPRECVLNDNECPLSIILQHPTSKGTLMFHLRRRTESQRLGPRAMSRSANDLRAPKVATVDKHAPYLLELSSGGRELPNARRFPIVLNSTQIGSNVLPNSPHIQLTGSTILPVHCIITMHSTSSVSIAPATRDAYVSVNGSRLTDRCLLNTGAIVNIGNSHTFRFIGSDSVDMKHGVPEQRVPEQRLRPASDYETTFDVDGHVETVTAKGPIETIQGSGLDLRFGPPGYEPDLLPATLSYREDGEDPFLLAIVSEVNAPAMQFRLSPAYSLYMALRSRASRLSRPDLSSDERDRRVNTLANKIVSYFNQIIRSCQSDPGLLSFWMANASELFHFMKEDVDICCSSSSAQSQLVETVRMAFNLVVTCFQEDLLQQMPAFLTVDKDDDIGRQTSESRIDNILKVLSVAMTLLRRCRVNAALTIQLFSQLYHCINMWLLNRVILEPRLELCTQRWGRILHERLCRIQTWSEKQGLELAADCHLAKVMQMSVMLESSKTRHDLTQLTSYCDSLNSLQLRRMFANYKTSPGEPAPAPDLIECLVNETVKNVDVHLRTDGKPLRVDEPPDLDLPFLIPDDGYSCDFVRGMPSGLAEFLDRYVQTGLCRLTINPNACGLWTIYMKAQQQDMHTYQNLKLAKGNPAVTGAAHEPEILTVSFSKFKNSLGLSIVTARGENQPQSAIYVKSVVPGGAADQDGRLQAGDQLLEVDGKSLVGVTQELAAEMMSRSKQLVTLKVAKQAALYHGLAKLIVQQSPTTSRHEHQRVQPIPEPRVRPTSEVISQPVPVFNNVQDVQLTAAVRPLNQQLEARSTPVLTGLKSSSSDSSRIFQQQPQRSAPAAVMLSTSGVSGAVVNAANGSRLDSSKLNSMSQPDLHDPYPSRIGSENQTKYQQGIDRQKRNEATSQSERSAGDANASYYTTAGKLQPSATTANPPQKPFSIKPITAQGSKPPGYATQMLFPGGRPPMKSTITQQSSSTSRVEPAEYDSSQLAAKIPNQLQGSSEGAQKIHVESSIQSLSSSVVLDKSATRVVEFGQRIDTEFPPPPSDTQLGQLKSLATSNEPVVNKSSGPVRNVVYPPPFNAAGQQQMVRPAGGLYSTSDMSSQQMVRPAGGLYSTSDMSSQQMVRPASGLYSTSDMSSAQVRNQAASSHIEHSRSASFETALQPQQPAKKPPPPPVAAKPRLVDRRSVAPSVWEKDEKEQSEVEQRQEKQQQRLKEISRLKSRPYLTANEQARLERLVVEAEFEKCAQDASAEDSHDQHDVKDLAAVSGVGRDAGTSRQLQQLTTVNRLEDIDKRQAPQRSLMSSNESMNEPNKPVNISQPYRRTDDNMTSYQPNANIQLSEHSNFRMPSAGIDQNMSGTDRLTASMTPGLYQQMPVTDMQMSHQPYSEIRQPMPGANVPMPYQPQTGTFYQQQVAPSQPTYDMTAGLRQPVPGANMQVPYSGIMYQQQIPDMNMLASKQPYGANAIPEYRQQQTQDMGVQGPPYQPSSALNVPPGYSQQVPSIQQQQFSGHTNQPVDPSMQPFIGSVDMMRQCYTVQSPVDMQTPRLPYYAMSSMPQQVAGGMGPPQPYPGFIMTPAGRQQLPDTDLHMTSDTTRVVQQQMYTPHQPYMTTTSQTDQQQLQRPPFTGSYVTPGLQQLSPGVNMQNAPSQSYNDARIQQNASDVGVHSYVTPGLQQPSPGVNMQNAPSQSCNDARIQQNASDVGVHSYDGPMQMSYQQVPYNVGQQQISNASMQLSYGAWNPSTVVGPQTQDFNLQRSGVNQIRYVEPDPRDLYQPIRNKPADKPLDIDVTSNPYVPAEGSPTSAANQAKADKKGLDPADGTSVSYRPPGEPEVKTRAIGASALKQPDSAPSTTKKTVTFNEKIATEYTVNRSYGSTSSESSFNPYSPDQVDLTSPSSSSPDMTTRYQYQYGYVANRTDPTVTDDAVRQMAAYGHSSLMAPGSADREGLIRQQMSRPDIYN